MALVPIMARKTIPDQTFIMRSLFLVSISVLLLTESSCKSKKSKDPDAPVPAVKGITEKFFGIAGTDTVIAYTFTNTGGTQVSIINYGGTVTSIITKDREGKDADVILGYESLEGYLQKGNPYFGCLVGRYGNRIANARFILDGKIFTLAVNNDPNALHGGIRGFDKVIWKAEKQPGDSSLKLTYVSKDGEEGYPGTLTTEVIYTLKAANELKIEYTAFTDKPTPVNLTNHCYFNLSGGTDSTILGHELMLNAANFTEVNDVLIPTGKLPGVKGTPMDFTGAKPIGKEIAAVKGGYDHNWVLNKNKTEPEFAGSLYHPGSGRLMEVFTTEPGIQFYSGNFLDGTLQYTRNGQKYIKHAGLCLETQHFPDSPNQPSFPNTILRPGGSYTQTTVYKFSVK